MSFMSEIAAAMGVGPSSPQSGYQIINYNGSAVYVEGFKRVLSIGDKEVVLACKAKRIVIAGESIYVRDLEKDALIICGDISSCTQEKL